METADLKDRGKGPLPTWLGHVEEQGWHSGDDGEPCEGVGKLLGERTQPPRVRNKFACVMMLPTPSQYFSLPETLFLSPCYE